MSRVAARSASPASSVWSISRLSLLWARNKASSEASVLTRSVSSRASTLYSSEAYHSVQSGIRLNGVAGKCATPSSMSSRTCDSNGLVGDAAGQAALSSSDRSSPPSARSHSSLAIARSTGSVPIASVVPRGAAQLRVAVDRVGTAPVTPEDVERAWGAPAHRTRRRDGAATASVDCARAFDSRNRSRSPGLALRSPNGVAGDLVLWQTMQIA